MIHTASRIGYVVGWISMLCWAMAIARAEPAPPQPREDQIKHLRGHTAKVSSIDISRDGRFAVSGAGAETNFFGLGRRVWVDCTARLWDLASGKEIRRYEGHAQAVTSVRFSPDDHLLLTGSSDNTVRIWNVWGPQIHQFAGITGVFSPSCRTVAVASKEGWIDVFELGFGQLMVRMVGHAEGATVLAYSTDGRMLVSGGRDGAVRVWDAKTGKALRTLRLATHENPLCVGFLPGDQRIVVVTDLALTQWEWQTGERRESLELASPQRRVKTAVLGEGGQLLFCVVPGESLKIYEVEKGQPIQLEPVDLGQIVQLAVSSDGKNVLMVVEPTLELIYRKLPAASSAN